jgi:nucleoside-diphosphate-sugar epimerase
MPRMGIAFVAGATGYTGREVVRIAVERGVETVAHVRPDSPELDAWRKRFEAMGASVDTTPWDEVALTSRLAGLRPTMVFALLGTTRARGRVENATYDTVDYGLSAMLRRAAAGVEPMPRFVYLSSAGVGASEPRRGSYMHARWAIEKELLEGTMPHLIARPSFITGDDRDDARPGERIGSAIADGALAFVGAFGGKKLKERYRSTSNTALASALVRLALDGASGVVESEGLR